MLSGDLVDHATPANYAALRRQLDQLLVPYLPMVGNHDDRALLREHLPVPETCISGFVQFAVPTPDGCIVCPDTLKPGAEAGAFLPGPRGMVAGPDDAGW